MWVVAIRRWQWVAVGLVVGLAQGAVRQWAASDFDKLLDRHGLLLTDPVEFEAALVSKAHGQRRFKDVVVHTFDVGRGRETRVVHVVSGKYWDGRVVEEAGGPAARYTPACFVAAAPYRPRIAPPGDGPGEAPGEAPREFPSVEAYLQSLRGASGVEFRRARWDWLREPLFVSSVGGVLLIGVVWPTLVNLLAFRSFWRPPDEKGASLADVRSKPDTMQPPAHAPPNALLELEAALEARLADAGATAETSPIATPPPAPVPALATGGAATLPTVDDDPDRTFAARSDDYYPTELHTPPPHPCGHRP